jgi:hypothetical protein
MAIYYLVFGYFFVTLCAVLLLRFTPFFSKWTLAAVNGLIYAAHGLWVILSLPSPPVPGIWGVWFSIVIFDFLSPTLLPTRLFDKS